MDRIGLNGLSTQDLAALHLNLLSRHLEQEAASRDRPDLSDGHRDDKHDHPNPGEPYFCPLCNFSTKRPGLLLRHTFQHTCVQPYSCWKCNISFSLPENLIGHFVDEHSVQGRLQCGTCRKSFGTRRGLVQHQVLFSIQRSRFCYYCAKGFPSDQAEQDHERSHSPGMAECWLKCPACRKPFPNLDALRIHSVFHLKLGADRFSPADSGAAVAAKYRRLISAGGANRKDKKRQSVMRRRYSCEHCDKVFVARTSLAWHRRQHRFPFACRACPKKYSTLCALLVHAADHDTISAIEEAQLRTMSHEAACSTKKQSMMVGTGSGLGLGTGTGVGGGAGVGTAVGAGGALAATERHECPTCGKAFGSANSLRAHKKSHTTGKTPHKCPTCGKQFVRSYDMKRHMRTHDSSAPYICQICQQKFSQSSSLKKHYKTHRLHCPLCLKQCDLPEQLQAHVATCPAQQVHQAHQVQAQSLLAAAFNNMASPEALAGLMQAAQGMGGLQHLVTPSTSSEHKPWNFTD